MGTRLPIILSCMLVNIPLVIWFMVSFFEELPEEVEESGNLHAFLYVCHGSGLCSAAVYPQAFGGAVPGGQVTDYRGNDADTEMISNITAANPKINSVLTEKYLHLSK